MVCFFSLVYLLLLTKNQSHLPTQAIVAVQRLIIVVFLLILGIWAGDTSRNDFWHFWVVFYSMHFENRLEYCQMYFFSRKIRFFYSKKNNCFENKKPHKINCLNKQSSQSKSGIWFRPDFDWLKFKNSPSGFQLVESHFSFVLHQDRKRKVQKSEKNSVKSKANIENPLKMCWKWRKLWSFHEKSLENLENN